MDYTKICDNCMRKNSCRPNFVYYTQKYVKFDITYTADVVKCKNYVPIKLVKIDRKELRKLAEHTNSIEELVKKMIKKRS